MMRSAPAIVAFLAICLLQTASSHFGGFDGLLPALMVAVCLRACLIHSAAA